MSQYNTSPESGKPIERFIPLLKHVITLRNGRGYVACCPAHNDKNPSLGVWEDEDDKHVGLKCYAGCIRQAIVEAIGLTESDLYVDGKVKRPPPSQGIDMFDLAANKLINPHLLDQLGITDGHRYRDRKAVHIPYYLPDGTLSSRYRIRTALTAKEGSFWNKGDEEVIPYGLERLGDARAAKELVIPEGESDCWAAWLHKIPALGIPGTEHYAKMKIEYLEGIDRVHIIQESPSAEDKASRRDPGKQFVENLYKHLVKIGYKGKIYAIDLTEFDGAKDINDLHTKNPKAFKTHFETAKLRAKPLHKVVPKLTTHRIVDLQAEVLPETRWAIDPILPEGVTILGGKPKLGKSWLALAILIAISLGAVALGIYPVEQGQVLYVALEDKKKRLQKRTNIVLQHAQASPDFEYTTECNRIDEGGLEQLEGWILDHPRARFICIDTWARFKPKPKGRQRIQYDEDYEAIAPLQELASKYSISILIVDHMRKMESEDPLDMLSGSTGKSGAADGFLLMYRKRGETDARLFVTGRDIEMEYEKEYLLHFEEHCASWVVKGDVDDASFASTPQQQEILTLLIEHEQGLPVKDIAEKLGKNINTARNLLLKLRNENKVVLINNIYKSVVSHSNHSKNSNHSNHSKSATEDPKVTTAYHEVTTAVTTAKSASDAPLTTLTTVATPNKRKLPLPPWLVPGTPEWNKYVERNGLEEAQECRRLALQAKQALA